MEELERERLELLRRQLAARQQMARQQMAQANQPEPIRELDGGGKVFRMEDGSLSYSSPGYSTNDQARIQELLKGQTPREVVQSGRDQEYMDAFPVRARVQEFTQGTPLVGEWFDEALPESRQRGSRALSGAMERTNPVESAAWNIAGGIATSLPAAMVAGPTAIGRFIGRGAGMLSTGLRSGAAAAGAGAIEGASAFAGRAEDGERLGAAAEGAVVGGALSGLVGALTPILGKAAASAVDRIRGLDVSTIADEFGISRQAAAVVRGYIANDDLSGAAAVLSRSRDAMLAESGPGTRQLLDTAMQTGGEALATGRKAVDGRVASASSRFVQQIDDILGTADGGIKGAAKEISESTRRARQTAYDRAYAQPTPTVGDGADAINDALSRINPNLMQSAVQKANDRMRADGLVNRNIIASIDDATGEVTFTQPLNIMQMDYIKRALGDISADGVDNLTGKQSSDAQLAGRLAGRLSDALKEHIPGYREALKLGGDTIQDTNALVMGRKLFSETTTVEDVRNTFRGASDTQKAAARKGIRESVEAIMGRARSTIADLEAGNIDFETGQNEVAQAVAAMRNLLTKNNVTKMNIVLGGDGQRLAAEMEKMADVMVLRAAVARNSATAIRQSGQEAIAAQTQPGTLKRAIGGLSPSEISGVLVGSDAGTVSGLRSQYMAEIVDALTSMKGRQAEIALRLVQDAMAGQPLRQEQANMIGRLVASGSTLAGERAGTDFYRRATQPSGPM